MMTYGGMGLKLHELLSQHQKDGLGVCGPAVLPTENEFPFDRNAILVVVGEETDPCASAS
jgi:hypothetical protein